MLLAYWRKLLGYMVIRFGHQDDWDEIIDQYPYVFGSGV
jgi:hypothetical protein